jgi:hypothetical protein
VKNGGETAKMLFSQLLTTKSTIQIKYQYLNKTVFPSVSDITPDTGDK